MPRLAIGPANYAGQAYAWAEAVNNHTDASAYAFTPQLLRGTGFSFRSHKRVSWLRYYLPFAQPARTTRLLKDASHVILDGYRTPLYDRRPDAFARTVSSMQTTFSLGLLAHGTDVRDPDAHLARNPHSYFQEGDDAWLAWARRTTARNRRFAAESGLPLFVSTPDLLRDLPGATWVPICTDVAAWASDRPLLAGGVPRVLFVPSQNTPPIKGTRYADPVLRALHDEGVIEYVSAAQVPHERMRQLVGSVDIVVDQLMFGSYGVAAIEAMAAGRIVIGSPTDLTTDLMPELPEIVVATPADFEDVLRGVLADPDAHRATTLANLDFVQRWHDGRESAARLAPFLGATLTG